MWWLSVAVPRSHGWVWFRNLCVCETVCACCAFTARVCPSQVRILNVRLSCPTFSPGMFWRWTAATGSELTFLTSSETLRWWKQTCRRRLSPVWVLIRRAEQVCNASQGRVVENISKRCGGFLRKLSLRGCLGVGDSALRWNLGKVEIAF